MATFNGSDLKISTGGTVIAKQTECSVDYSMDPIDVTTKDSNSTAEFIPGLKSWTMQSSGLIDFAAGNGIDELWDALLAGTLLSLKFATATVGSTKLEGSAYITNIVNTAPKDEAPTWEVTFQGTGALTKGTV